jgi:hypothetical protein
VATTRRGRLERSTLARLVRPRARLGAGRAKQRPQAPDRGPKAGRPARGAAAARRRHPDSALRVILAERAGAVEPRAGS